jgi:large subunit ribosomal protein L4e
MVIEAKDKTTLFTFSRRKQHSALEIQHVNMSGKQCRKRNILCSKKNNVRRARNLIGQEQRSKCCLRRRASSKLVSMINTNRINKKEMALAFKSALSATGDEKLVAKRYERLKDKKLSGFPLVVENKITHLKAKNLISSLKKILGDVLFEVSLKQKRVRSGKGKLRGRKYKKNLGLLLVVGNKEKLNTNIIDVKKVNGLNVTDLANGGVGRLTIYTEEAIKEIEEKIK